MIADGLDGPQDLFCAQRYLSLQQTGKSGHQAGIVDHESHEPRGIAANAEEFQHVILHRVFEVGMGRKAYAMAVYVS